MILRIRVDHFKDKTKKKKRVFMAKLTTEIEGMEEIQTVAELDPGSGMAHEIDELIANMLALKTEDLKRKKSKKQKENIVEKAVKKIVK